MIALERVALLLLATVGSLFMAWTVGAGSSGSTPFAPAVGANSISVMRAGFIVGILGFTGAILQGTNVSETIGSGLIQNITLPSIAVIITLFTAALLVIVGIFTGYPIATAFTVTGAVTGVGLALGGLPAWNTYGRIATLWILTPFVGASVSYSIARMLNSPRLPTDVIVGALGFLTLFVVVNMEFSVLAPPGQSQSLSSAILSFIATTLKEPGQIGISLVLAGTGGIVLKQRHRVSDVATECRFLIALGCLVAFSAGATQVGLAVGPLLPLLDEWEVPLIAILGFGGLGLLAGSWTGAPRMIKALSQDYSALGPKRSIASLVPSFIIAQVAVFLGVPVSFNEIIVSAIIGSGYAGENAPVSVSKMRNTILAWIVSFCLSGAFGYSAMRVIASIP
ncbi:inorganic phosphate transporter [Halorhabdus amylolytica]|uniref:inorganic phosphate transporter n=1 Tax=Halorhabdus amylolytica TaxID=2559573 RepID=UPI0010A9E544|nr:inorganic phosphate transporter [Halorhabdus amylolytica]